MGVSYVFALTFAGQWNIYDWGGFLFSEISAIEIIFFSTKKCLYPIEDVNSNMSSNVKDILVAIVLCKILGGGGVLLKTAILAVLWTSFCAI